MATLSPACSATGSIADRPLRILQVNTWDSPGGAANIARSLSAAYRARGHESWLAVSRKAGDDPGVLPIPNWEARGNWFHFWRGVDRQLRRVARESQVPATVGRLLRGIAEPSRALDYYRGVEHFHYPGTWHLLRLTAHQPDLVHCHNLHGGYFDLRALPRLSETVPLVLTLHDAWLLSGHCAHSLDCERWKTGCGRCPDLTLHPAIIRDATGQNWRRKQAIYRHSSLYVATPSRWLMGKVEQSMLAPAVLEARVVPNGVDLSIYHPDDKRSSRASLGIPDDAHVVLFAGESVRDNMWKDYRTVRDAIARAANLLAGRSALFIALGNAGSPERIGQADVRFVPYVRDPQVVASYYQAADVYVHAARADTFPSTVLEAMACGTPVVATAVGGIPEQVEDTRTGYLVPPGDAQGLATRLTQLLSDDNLRLSMGTLAAQIARERFDFSRQVDAYLEWYAELIGHRRSTRRREEV